MNVLKQQWISLIILTLLVQPMLVLGQTTDKTNWSNVTSLPAGTSVSIKTKSRKNFEGTINNVSDMAVVVLENGASKTVDRSDIKKLYRIDRKGSKTKWAVIGGIVGAGVGIAAAFGLVAAGAGGGESEPLFPVVVVAGAGAGTALGLLTPGPGKTLIYEVK